MPKKPEIQLSQGLTLIELLVALLVFSVGLLGLAGMQARGLRANQGAWHRSEANILAYDILDRIRANRDASGNWTRDYALALTDSKPSVQANQGETNPIVQADRDLHAWLSEIENRLPSGDGAVSIVDSVVTVTVQWVDGQGADAPQQLTVQSR
jgi:type IV pilus assembly protein PilV